MRPCCRARTHVCVVGALLATMACRDPIVNPDNELPSGAVEVPKAGDALKAGPTTIGGWAIDDSGVREVRVFFDGRFKGATTLTVPRPDIAKAMPKYARHSDLCGWSFQLDLGTAAGAHTILVQAVDDSGATRDIGVIPVNVAR